MFDKYVIVKYLRLSIEDGDKPESDSISNQRNLLDYHINALFKEKDTDVIEIVDDGYSGTNLNRPGIKKLLILAETRQINCVVVKDFSRFARDYVDAGTYIEQKFPEWMVRFISVNDKYDSNDFRGITGGIDMALKSIVYTMYSRDLSEKIKSARRIQYKSGKHIPKYAFYGYLKSPEDKYKIIIDPATAGTVQRIFALRADGVMPSEIARILNSENIPTPAACKEAADQLQRKWNHRSEYYCWTKGIVSKILRDERYTGKMINGVRESVGVGSRKTKLAASENIVVVENTHEPIISQEIFDSVQTLTRRRKRHTVTRISLRGLVCCGGCRHCMEPSNTRGVRMKFLCSYKKYTDDNDCFEGVIAEDDLCSLLIKTIRGELEKAVDISKAQEQVDRLFRRNESTIKAIEGDIKAEKKKKLSEYVRFTKNEISEEELIQNGAMLDEEIGKLSNQIQIIKDQSIAKEEASILNLFERYIGIEGINYEIVKDLVKAIYIYQDMRIKIVWNFRDIIDF